MHCIVLYTWFQIYIAIKQFDAFLYFIEGDDISLKVNIKASKSGNATIIMLVKIYVMIRR